jgi:predicted transcriptional regulator
VEDNAEVTGGEAIDYVELTTEIVSAYVSKNSVRPADMPELLKSVHLALAGLNQSSTLEAPLVEKLTPAQIRKSITPDALISFEDGKRYKTLKRHLTVLGLSPETYRQKWGLPRDYPIVAASYSEARSTLAKGIGLGQHGRNAAPRAAEPAETVPEKPKRAVGRPRKAKESAEA